MKFVVGIITGSLGILSEALHSALDLVAALGSLVAVKIAARPADNEHPYGHGKIENLMALVETLLLLATAAWVVVEATERLLSDNPEALHVETSIWAFVVVVVSLVVDINRSAMLKRVAKETKSAALEADADMQLGNSRSMNSADYSGRTRKKMRTSSFQLFNQQKVK